MKPTVGLWIDHRKAVIVVVSEKGEETTQIDSHVESQPGRVAGVRSTTPYEWQHVPADDSHQRKLTGHLHDYYDEVIAFIRDAESILIFGPGEAKDELNKRLHRDKQGRGEGRSTSLRGAPAYQTHQRGRRTPTNARLTRDWNLTVGCRGL
jgi:hypothetical protein